MTVLVSGKAAHFEQLSNSRMTPLCVVGTKPCADTVEITYYLMGWDDDNRDPVVEGDVRPRLGLF
jgi:hypothetical protein